MEQPLGFKDPAKPNHACKLKKTIYGLKQAPPAWYNELNAFLIANSFTNSKIDNSLFIYSHNGIEAYFLVYVDDLVIIATTLGFLMISLQHYPSIFRLKIWGP